MEENNFRDEYCSIDLGSLRPYLPLGMPRLKHPLIDFKSYQIWGAFLEWNQEVIDFIQKEQLSGNEVKTFINKNKYCINEFNFVVELLNLDSEFHCSKCELLSERIRSLINNIFYLFHFEKEPNLVLLGTPNNEWCSPVMPRVFHLKEYYDKLKDINETINLDDFIGKNLSTFMPCVAEMTLQKEKDTIKKQFRLALKGINKVCNITQAINYELIYKKNIILYKISQMLFSHFIATQKKIVHNQCKLIRELFFRFLSNVDTVPTLVSNNNSGPSLITYMKPSFMVFSDYKKYYKFIIEKLDFKLNIVQFFLKLYLCQFEKVSFCENIRVINEYSKEYALREYLPKNSENEKNDKLNVLLFTIRFDESIKDCDKDNIIRHFLSDSNYKFQNFNFLKKNDSFCCSYYSGTTRIYILFIKNNDLKLTMEGSIVCRIIKANTFYETLKQYEDELYEHENKGIILDNIFKSQNILIYFNKNEKSIAAWKEYINQIIGNELYFKKRMCFLEPKKITLIHTLKIFFNNKFKEDNTLSSLNSYLKADAYFWKFYFNCAYAIKDNNSERAIRDYLRNIEYFNLKIRDIKQLAQEIKNRIESDKSKEINLDAFFHDHPEYIAPLNRKRNSKLKSWFLPFDNHKTEKHNEHSHKVHNLATLIVVFSFFYLLFKHNHIITQEQIERYIKGTTKSVKEQFPKWSEETARLTNDGFQDKRIKFNNNMNDFLQKKLKEICNGIYPDAIG